MKRKTIAELKRRAQQTFHNSIINSQTEVALDMWPAQELFELIKEPTPIDWHQKWTDAGGKIFDGRMIALKHDPIWSRISKFNLPYSPFDEYDVMEQRDVDRRTAVNCGLISEWGKVQPVHRTWAEDKIHIRSSKLK